VCHMTQRGRLSRGAAAPREAVERLLRANIWAPIRRPTEVLLVIYVARRATAQGVGI